eukprot:TRINITY_DN1571_c1_g2_i1.p1 TRINITY_DN1571_c1_g2~~TRINITY_DN1571_c1_g2_i1.p1  ORF type:complete len:206 (-),score=66.84 TRINITY_DN1571_c1_g2_i1:404-1021(-)
MSMPGMAMGDGMSAMTVEQFQNISPQAQTTMLFRMTQGMMPMMAMMRGMMPGMMDMRLMSPFFTARAGEFFWFFRGARVDSDGAFAGALIGSFLFALLATIAMELLKRMERRAIASPAVKVPQALLAGAAQAVRMALHYLAMLLIMTYNVWVFLVVVAGHGVGYALFRLFGPVGAPVGGSDSATYGAVGQTKQVDAEVQDTTDCC